MSVHHSPPRLDDLARHLRGRLIMSGDSAWDTVRRPWNLRVDQRPAAIVEPAGADDMAATVAFAGLRGLRVTAQCTGHGAGADLADTILLRTSGLRETILDPGRGQARVGAGVRCADLLTAGSEHGLSISIGTAASAGVAGFAMFGGVGVLGRALGFVAHQIVAANAVTADGSRIRVTDADHPDLLWALRGGGGGFAIITHLELRLARVPALFGGQLVWSAAAAPDVFHTWRSWTAGLPPEMTSSCALVQLPPLPEVPEPLRGRRVAAVTACFTGPPDEGAALLKLLTRTCAPLFDTCRSLQPADLATLAGAPSTLMPNRIHGELLNDLPDAALSEFFTHAGPESDPPVFATEIRHLGGAYAAKPPDGAGAIGQTSSQYFIELIGLAATGEADTAIRSYQQRVTAALAPCTTSMILPSFAEPDTDAGRVFPPEVRRRLARVKRRYDPGGVLRTSFAF
ncbi:MAG TPA: FAD-binding oxidoreductase [Trebonia sp.]|jgi:hypothetical protein